jgi:hypothetical protein
MARIYDPSSYDGNFCLKPPALLWLAALYLSRAFVLLIASDVASVARIGPDVATMLHGAASVYALVPSLVAAPLLYALIFRAPTSPKPVRWIWAHGRTILIAAAILDCAASVAASGVMGGDVADLNAGLLLPAVFDVYFLVYVVATRRIRDVFADFPPPELARPRRRS